MAVREKADRSKRALLAACLAALFLVLFLAVFETRERGLSCASLAQATVDATPIEAPHAPVLTPPEETPAAAARTANGERVQGRVVDKRAHDGVPWIKVEVRAGSNISRTATDAQGAFTSSIPFAAGKIEIEVSDDGHSFGAKSYDWKGLSGTSRIEIQIDIGPTVRAHAIGFEPPAGQDDWRVRLVQTARPPGSAGEIEVHDEDLRMVSAPDIEWSTISLRFEEQHAFARWRRVEHEPAAGFRPRVDVRSEVRCERGSAAIVGTLGVQELPDVETGHFLLLSGCVTAASRKSSASVHVLLRPNDIGADQDIWRTSDFHAVEALNGEFKLELDADQTYTAVAWANGFEPLILEQNLRASGPCKLRTAALRPLDVALPAQPLRLLAEPEDSSELQWLARARVLDTGAFADAVVIHATRRGSERMTRALPATRYECEIIGVDSSPLLHGEAWTQVLPAPLEPEGLPRASPHPHRFEWIDPLTNAPHADFAVTAGPSGCIVTTKAVAPDARFDVVPGAPLQFTVWRPGCEPVALDAKSFATRGDESVATFAPRPGWGVLIAFRVVAANDRERSADSAQGDGLIRASALPEILSLPPLAGVGVTSAAGGFGTSDADGCLLLHARLWPPHLSLKADGYRLSSLRRMSGPGSRWIAFMERDR